MRAHGNNAEFMPLRVLMLLIAELSGGSSMWLHVLGGSLLITRVAHAIRNADASDERLSLRGDCRDVGDDRRGERLLPRAARAG